MAKDSTIRTGAFRSLNTMRRLSPSDIQAIGDRMYGDGMTLDDARRMHSDLHQRDGLVVGATETRQSDTRKSRRTKADAS